MSVTATIKSSVTGTQASTLDLATATIVYSLANNIALTSGVAEGMIDKLFSDTRTLAASGTEDLDVYAGLLDALGSALNLAKLKLVLITADAANTNDVVVSRPASNGVPLFGAASDAISVKPGGTFMWVAPETGVTVTASTGDLITITNSSGGTGVTYSVVLLGTSA